MNKVIPSKMDQIMLVLMQVLLNTLSAISAVYVVQLVLMRVCAAALEYVQTSVWNYTKKMFA